MILKRGGELKNNRKTGAECEQKAARFLESRGYEIVDKNYYCPHGEIDIIAKEAGDIVFVEVKYRKNFIYGGPECAVNFKKRKHMIESAMGYMAQKYESVDISCRFDVVAITGSEIHLIKNAFDSM